jgi:prepilin-type N-terminal cleavage/methylation domain-containing protein
MNTQNPKKQLGYTLIELSIGLAITSLVLVGVVAGVQKMMEQVNVNRSVNQIASAVERIRLIVKRDGDASSINMATMTQPINNAFAASNVTNPGTASAQAFNALGNRMELFTAWDNWAPTNQHFRIVLRNVTPTTCLELSAALEGLTSAVFVNSNGWQTLRDDRSGVVFGMANARRFCPTTAMTELALEFLK